MTADRMTEEVLQIVDKHMQEPSLREMVREFVADKAEEGWNWAAVTRLSHQLAEGSHPPALNDSVRFAS